MTWRGKIRTSTKLGAPIPITYKGRRYGVPRRVTMTLEGLRGSPDLRVECAVIDGVPGVREVHIVSKPDGEAIRDAHLNAIALDKIALQSFMDHAMDVSTDGEVAVLTPVSEGTEDVLRGQLDEAQKTGRGPSQAELTEVARVYRENSNNAPAAAVELRLGYSRRTAQRRIKQAEEAGLLPPTSQGKRRR